MLDWSAHRLSRAIAAREISPSELMTATLARIEAINPQLNAIVSLGDPDVLLARAKMAETETSRGWLHGIPVAVKDLANAKGYPTSMGSPAFVGQVADTSDIAIARMEAAGAIVIGKTNTPEFGLGSHTYNPVHGATQNALLPGRSAGGSSGGAAVALAAGLIAVADGSDMMGSLRNPAGWNGVYGLRPSWGRVPSETVGDLFWKTLSTNGPMARTPRDLALLLDTMSGADPCQPHGWDAPPVAGQIDADLAGRRIAWLGDWGGALAMEDGVLAHSRSSLERLTDLGVVIEDVPPPFSREALWQAWIDLRSFSVSQSLGPLLDTQPDVLKPEAVWEIERGRGLSALALQSASAIRSDWFRAARSLLSRFDAFALPTAQCWPFPVELDWPKSIAGTAMDTYHRWMEVVISASLIGLPAIAVPCPPDDLGRPIGVQIAGSPRADLAVLQLAAGWHSLSAA